MNQQPKQVSDIGGFVRLFAALPIFFAAVCFAVAIPFGILVEIGVIGS